MSPPWSQPLEVDRLADSGADLSCAVSLAELPGLRSLWAGVEGQVRAEVHFAREQGMPVAELTLAGNVTLECQRCLQPLELPVRSVTRIALLSAEADATRVAADLEPVLAPGGRISVGELITEELLLALPIVALHAEEECSAGTAPQESAPAREETQRPFAGLGELLKR
jgi:uncharacterized protein